MSRDWISFPPNLYGRQERAGFEEHSQREWEVEHRDDESTLNVAEVVAERRLRLELDPDESVGCVSIDDLERRQRSTDRQVLRSQGRTQYV